MPIRDLLSKTWRWPLYSRTRAVSLAVLIVLAVLVGPRIVNPTSASRPEQTAASAAADTGTPTTDDNNLAAASSTEPDPAAAATAFPASSTPVPHSAAAVSKGVSRPNTSEVAAASPLAAAAQDDGQVKRLATAPRPPALTTNRSDYASPLTAAQRYLQVWCWQPAQKPANTNIADVASWVTAAGWADDKSRAVTPASWKRTQAAGLTSSCGPITAYEAAEAPQTDEARWVNLSARQAFVNRAGKIVGQQTITQTRRVLRAPDGRWLVDIEVTAG